MKNFKERSSKHYNIIRQRIKSGFYNTDEVILIVANKLLRDFYFKKSLNEK